MNLFESNEKKLKKLFEEQEKLNNKIQKLVKENSIIQNELDEEYSNSLPSDLEKFSGEQINWLLSYNNKSSETKHKILSEITRKYFWAFSGFWYSINQAALQLSLEKIKCNKIKIIEFFNLIFKYIKTMTIDSNGNIETGKIITITGLASMTTSTLYVKENCLTLYITSYRKKDFKSFDEFCSWCELQHLED